MDIYQGFYMYSVPRRKKRTPQANLGELSFRDNNTPVNDGLFLMHFQWLNFVTFFLTVLTVIKVSLDILTIFGKNDLKTHFGFVLLVTMYKILSQDQDNSEKKFTIHQCED